MTDDTDAPIPFPRVVEYSIDAEDRVLETGEDWGRAATDNDAPELLDVRGTNLFSAITDATLAELWRLILANVRDTQEGRRFDLRCDAPALRRFIALDVRPDEGGRVTFCSREARVEVREPVVLLDRRTERNDSLLQVCAWCARVKAPAWMPIEAAVERLMLFEQRPLPRISHGICPECFAKAMPPS